MNFRTGTYLRETSQDLKHADFFFNFNFGQPAISFRVPTKPRPRLLRQSNSSPSTPTNSNSESLIILNGKQDDSFIANGFDAQTSLFVTTGKSQETFFDVVSEAAKQAGIGSPAVFMNYQTSNEKPCQNEKQPIRAKGYLRKGLREKLAQKAEQARSQVQKLEKVASHRSISKENQNTKEGENIDSGLGSDILGGTESFESADTDCDDLDHSGDPGNDMMN